MKELISVKGEPIVALKDEEFIGISENPFAHGCCDCGLWHRVEYALVDLEGNEVPFPENTRLALRFTRDDEQTAHFREQRATPEAANLSRELKAGVTEAEVSLTMFGDVAINDLDRDALLRIITLLAVGKRQEAPSRIIRV